MMNICNTNLHFNLNKEKHRRAWEHLQHMDKCVFKSHSNAAIDALNDFFDRYYKAQDAPIGYMRDPEQKGHLLIDPNTRWIVEKIFDLAVHDMGAAKITRVLHLEKVPTPGYLNYQRHGAFAHIYAGQPEDEAYNWSIGQVKSILKSEVYIGHSVHNQQTNISFKNKKKVRKPMEEWFKVENTHEAIVTEEDFRHVPMIIYTRKIP